MGSLHARHSVLKQPESREACSWRAHSAASHLHTRLVEAARLGEDGSAGIAEAGQSARLPVLSMSTRASGGLQQNPTISNGASRHVGSYSAREMDAPSGEVCSPGRMRILVEDPELRRPTLGDSNGWLVLCRISIPVFKNLRTCTGVQVGEA
jgi:hypothetical protein